MREDQMYWLKKRSSSNLMTTSQAAVLKFPGGLTEAIKSYGISVLSNDVTIDFPVTIPGKEGSLVLFIGMQEIPSAFEVLATNVTPYGVLANLNDSLYEWIPISRDKKRLTSESSRNKVLASLLKTGKLQETPVSSTTTLEEQMWNVMWSLLQRHLHWTLKKFKKSTLYFPSEQQNLDEGVDCQKSVVSSVLSISESECEQDFCGKMWEVIYDVLTTYEGLKVKTDFSTGAPTYLLHRDQFASPSDLVSHLAGPSTTNVTPEKQQQPHPIERAIRKTPHRNQKSVAQEELENDAAWASQWYNTLVPRGWKLTRAGQYVIPGHTANALAVDYFEQKEFVRDYLEQLETTTCDKVSEELEDEDDEDSVPLVCDFKTLRSHYGGKFYPPKGLNSCKYVLRDGDPKGQEGIDFFYGEQALLSYWMSIKKIRLARNDKHVYEVLDKGYFNMEVRSSSVPQEDDKVSVSAESASAVSSVPLETSTNQCTLEEEPKLFSFKQLWKKNGGKACSPKGLETEWRYVPFGGTNTGVQGLDYFLGETDMLRYWIENEIVATSSSSRNKYELLNEEALVAPVQRKENNFTFTELWKKNGGKAFSPTKLSMLFRYVPTGGSTSGVEGVDYFLGEEAVLTHWIENKVIEVSQEKHKYKILDEATLTASIGKAKARRKSLPAVKPEIKTKKVEKKKRRATIMPTNDDTNTSVIKASESRSKRQRGNATEREKEFKRKMLECWDILEARGMKKEYPHGCDTEYYFVKPNVVFNIQTSVRHVDYYVGEEATLTAPEVQEWLSHQTVIPDENTQPIPTTKPTSVVARRMTQRQRASSDATREDQLRQYKREMAEYWHVLQHHGMKKEYPQGCDTEYYFVKPGKEFNLKTCVRGVDYYYGEEAALTAPEVKQWIAEYQENGSFTFSSPIITETPKKTSTKSSTSTTTSKKALYKSQCSAKIQELWNDLYKEGFRVSYKSTAATPGKRPVKTYNFFGVDPEVVELYGDVAFYENIVHCRLSEKDQLVNPTSHKKSDNLAQPVMPSSKKKLSNEVECRRAVNAVWNQLKRVGFKKTVAGGLSIGYTFVVPEALRDSYGGKTSFAGEVEFYNNVVKDFDFSTLPVLLPESPVASTKTSSPTIDNPTIDNDDNMMMIDDDEKENVEKELDFGNVKKVKRSLVNDLNAVLDDSYDVVANSEGDSVLSERSAEMKSILDFFQSQFVQDAGSSLYISGAPGTGKSLVMRQVTQQLRPLLIKIHPVKQDLYMHICNSNSIGTPVEFQSALFAELRYSNTNSQNDNSTDWVSKVTQLAMRKDMVLVIDEFDSLLQQKNVWGETISELFRIAYHPNSKLILVGISNSTDMKDRCLEYMESAKGNELKTVIFQPYNHYQLKNILVERVGKFNVFQEMAIQLVAQRVARENGDVRRALGILKLAVEEANRRGLLEKRGDVIGYGILAPIVKKALQPSYVNAVSDLLRISKVLIYSCLSISKSDPIDLSVDKVRTQFLRSGDKMGLELDMLSQEFRSQLSTLSQIGLITEAGNSAAGLYSKRIVFKASNEDLMDALKKDAFFQSHMGKLNPF